MIDDLDRLKGQHLGQYELVDLLGKGGMGAVYRGFQASLQRDVAVKVIYAAPGLNDRYEERFQREARMAASLEHSHIVPVYDFGTDQGISYVVMRLLSGGSLADAIETARQNGNGFIPLLEVAQITRDLASALQYAHQRSVIHRDIKASNVMFDDLGTVFLVDFGIAKMAGATTELTASGFKVGTPVFMAPEQWRNETLTPAVDQYALAILVYHMLTGRSPFRGDDVFQLMHSHLNEPPDPLMRWRDDLPDDALMPVLERALRKSPLARYPDVERFAEAFSKAVEISQPSPAIVIQRRNDPAKTINLADAATPALIAAPRRPRIRLLGAAALFVLLLVVTGFGLMAAVNKPPNDPMAAAADEGSPTELAGLATGSPSPTQTHTAEPTAMPTITATTTASPTGTASPVAVAMVAEPASFRLPLTAMASGDNAVIDLAVVCPLNNCHTLDITIQFDPTIIQVDSIDPGSSLFEPVLAADNRIDNEAGVIRLIAAVQEIAPAEEPDDRFLELHVKAVQPGTSPLRVDQLYVFDQDGQSMDAVAFDGGIFVTGEGAASAEATCTYQVRSGDTLSAIAAANGVTVAQIGDLNDIPNQSVIRVGQELTIPASTCHAPSQVRSSTGSSEIVDVYDCRNLGGNVFEWYKTRVDYDAAGNPVNATHIAGPFSGAWQPGCPGEQPSNTSSSNNHSSGSSANSSNQGGSGDTSGSGNSGGGSSGGGGGLGGVICTLLC